MLPWTVKPERMKDAAIVFGRCVYFSAVGNLLNHCEFRGVKVCNLPMCVHFFVNILSKLSHHYYGDNYFSAFHYLPQNVTCFFSRSKK